MSIDERDSVLHSWWVQADWDAPTVVGGEGARLHLADGRAILDMSSLAECSNLGHQHPRVVAAIRAQAERLCFVTNAWGAQPRARAGRGAAGTFRASRAAACSSPSAAPTPTSTRSRSRARPRGKPRGAVIARDRSYHGATLPGDGAVGRCAHAAAGRRRGAWACITSPPPYAYRCPFGSDDADECGVRAADAVARAHRRARRAIASPR